MENEKMQNDDKLEIKITWDSNFMMWSAQIEDAPGIEVEAVSFDGLINGIKEVIPEITLLTKEEVIDFTGDSEGKRTSSVDSIAGILEGQDTGKNITKHDIRHMTDQELNRLTEKAVEELYTRQKSKSAAIIQKAVEAKTANDEDCFHELCARAGEAQATEEILRQFLGRF